MTAIELLGDWIKQAGVNTDILDESGRVCSFIYNNDFPVSLEAPPYCDDLFIVIELSEIGGGEIRRKRLEAAMRLNAYGLETRGGIVGWDTIGERIILSYRVTAEEATGEQLDNIIANLLEVAEQIRPELAMEKEKAIQETMANQFDPMFKPVSP